VDDVSADWIAVGSKSDLTGTKSSTALGLAVPLAIAIGLLLLHSLHPFVVRQSKRSAIQTFGNPNGPRIALSIFWSAKASGRRLTHKRMKTLRQIATVVGLLARRQEFAQWNLASPNATQDELVGPTKPPIQDHWLPWTTLTAALFSFPTGTGTHLVAGSAMLGSRMV
jgi:hypothetical protein